MPTCKQVIVEAFGGPEQLKIVESPMPEPGAGQVRVRLTSIGMNQAELLGRKGGYKASTGEVPFTVGIEGGGVIDALGDGVSAAHPELAEGVRVTLGPNVPRGVDGPHGGTYRTHMVVDANAALPVPFGPDVLPDDEIGCLWLPYLTAYGCLVWQAGLKAGDIVGIPAASSSVGLAASQVVKAVGARAIGFTSSPGKVQTLEAMDTARFDDLVITHESGEAGGRVIRKFHRDIKQLTDGHGVDVWFDCVAAGEYLSTEVRALAGGGRLYLYGLLGEAGVVDLQPLIIRRGSIHTFVLYNIVSAGEAVWRAACEAIFKGFADGAYRQRIAGKFAFDDVREAHAAMEKGEHIGKMVLVP